MILFESISLFASDYAHHKWHSANVAGETAAKESLHYEEFITTVVFQQDHGAAKAMNSFAKEMNSIGKATNSLQTGCKGDKFNCKNIYYMLQLYVYNL